ncbi:MAG TPA: hypothetical protein DEB24_06825, partial [Coriobacteriia bacterium]|nr:hypothetical protein [Coriobacteriia bacterium]
MSDPKADIKADPKAKGVPKEKKKKLAWGKPAKNEKSDSRESTQRLIGGILTLFLTIVIIASGFLIPTIAAPYIDSYNDHYVQLPEPTDSTTLTPIPREPVTLTPWNIYDVSRLRQLNEEEQTKLDASGSIDFLIAVMRDHGMQFAQEERYYRGKILSDFRCLEPHVQGGPRFFILYSEDLNEDGAADVRCAVDYDGKIIWLLLLSAEWNTVILTEPIDVTGGTSGAGATGGVEVGGDPGATGNDTGTTGTAGANQGAGDTENAESTGMGADTGTGTNQGAGTQTPGSSSLMQPNSNDGWIWAFSYATSREAYLFSQTDVFNAFRQLDFYYEGVYGVGFNSLIPGASSEPEVLPNDP